MNIIELLSEKQKKQIIYKDLKVHETLFHENDLCQYLGILIKGKIEIISYLADGKEIIYNTLKDGDLFGNNLIFSSEPYYKGNIIAVSESMICLMHKDVLSDVLSNNKPFLNEYLKVQANFTKKLNDTIKLLSIDSAEERFYYYMHERKNLITFDSISSLTKQMYLSRETLSRLLSRLVKNNSIIKENNMIILK